MELCQKQREGQRANTEPCADFTSRHLSVRALQRYEVGKLPPRLRVKTGGAISMNQNDQMREALRRYDEFECKNCDQQLNKAERTIEIFRQALDHVNETPKNEHVEPEVCTDRSMWCRYIAGLICTYLKDGSHEKAITGIIERRLRNLPERQPAPQLKAVNSGPIHVVCQCDAVSHNPRWIMFLTPRK